MPAGACQFFQPRQQEALARVGDTYLFPEDLQALGLNNVQNSQDSSQIANAFIDAWIQQQIITQQALRNLSADQLQATNNKVEDYKNSLLSYSYEQRMIAEKMDTVITEQQIDSLYASSEWLLDEPILKGIFVKTDSIMAKADSLTLWLNAFPESENDSELLRYCAYNALECQLNESRWWTFTDWTETIPFQAGIAIDDLKIGKAFIEQSNGDKYLCRVLEVQQRGKAPLEHIQEQLEEQLLRERQQNFIRALKEQLYNAALNNNEIEVYEND